MWFCDCVINGSLSPFNAVRFIGVVVSPLCMVTEFCGRGNLFDLLHDRDVPLPWALRKRMALDAAKGMACMCVRGLLEFANIL